MITVIIGKLDLINIESKYVMRYAEIKDLQ